MANKQHTVLTKLVQGQIEEKKIITHIHYPPKLCLKDWTFSGKKCTLCECQSQFKRWTFHVPNLQRWLYWREHLKYVWNVYCVATNHRWDLHTTETTDNNRFRSVMEQIIFVLFKDTNCLIRNLKHRCSQDQCRGRHPVLCSILERKVLEANATRRRPAFHVTTYPDHMKTIKNEQSWCFLFWWHNPC